jgi:hypothetical protein
MKIVLWHGTGLLLIYKRLEGSGFIGPSLLMEPYRSRRRSLKRFF